MFSTRYKVYKIITLVTLSLFCFKSKILALSASMQSQYDYEFSLDMIRDLEIIVKNYGDEKTNQNYNYENIKALFRQAAERHYAQEFLKPVSVDGEIVVDNNFQSSLELFQKLKIELIKTYDRLAKDYMTRTRAILDSTSKETNEVIIKYSKKNSLAKHFYEPVNPLYEPKPYKTEEFHLFYEKGSLERYLKEGYKVLHEAAGVLKDGDFIYIKSKKKNTSSELNFMLKKYQKIIKLCRKSKIYGIEIHKKLKVNQLQSIQEKYDINQGMILRYEIFDDRIPEEYKVDAIDSHRRDYQIEKARLAKRAKVLQRKPQ